VITDILKFILEYWIYLLIVLGSLVIIIIISAIFNHQSRSVETPTVDQNDISSTIKLPKTNNFQQPSDNEAEILADTVNESHELPDPIALSIIDKSNTILSPAIDPADQALPFDSDSLDPDSLDLKPLESTVNTEEPSETKNKVSDEKIEPISKPKPKKMLGKYHVMYRADGKWYVKREGSDIVMRVLETQREAVSWATIKALTQNVGIVVHKRDGKISKNNPL